MKSLQKINLMKKRISLIYESKKEDKIKDIDEPKERIKEEYIKQNSKTTHKLDLTMLDVSMVKDMSYIFADKRNDKYPYAELKSIDVSNWDVSNVTDMYCMFDSCLSLESIDVSKWDVRHVKNMSGMFYRCESLESIDVSNWDVSNVKDMHSMFEGCESLESIDVSNWSVDYVESMSYMFYGCKSLESIDVSNWDVRDMRDIKNMFNGCKFDYKLQGNKLIKI